MKINMTIDDRELKALIGELDKGDARFTIAKSLTQTAKAAQRVVKDDLPTTFRLRSEWVSRGIRITPATKESLQAEVGSRNQFMYQHALGGRRPQKKALVAVPVAAREPKSKITPRAEWPRALLRRPDGKFFLASILKNRAAGIFEDRTEEGKRPRLVYYLVKSVQIKPRWDLDGQVENVMHDKYPGILKRNLTALVLRRRGQREKKARAAARG